ncbi:hypothetical protein MUDAN_MDHGFNIF_03534 [Lactiplantibacillus mudanjiangensis]|uniref:Uncharacterized protein n=1 Tax=Lactiplantibacillus mudanjiangensis TaxID=1296538 RepID=A0A660E0I6_9LACO|nr:hypothetical protein MUDAN_IGPPGNFN_02245 [Lactiplantibacillus mudanjiangensis]VDG29620.1 hypothetical protein MUDAN_MDHGFNIF_03534 [Lactiplantibacillus mudanjiangensis]
MKGGDGMKEEQVERLITELHELNKTFKATCNSLERWGY